MTDDDRVQFAAVLRKLGAVFGREITADAADGYFWALESLPLETVKQAAMRAMQECKFMPVPSELIGFCPKRSNKYLSCGGVPSQQATARLMGWDCDCEFHDRDRSKPALRFDPICPVCRRFEKGQLEAGTGPHLTEGNEGKP